MADNGVHLNGNGTQTPRQQAAEEQSAALVEPRIHLNGNRPAKVEQVLTSHQTYSYKPQLPIYGFRDEYWTGPEFYYDVEAMLMHDSISTPLEYVKSPLSQMQVAAKGSSTRVVQFILDEWTKFKEQWLPMVQHPGYAYGWMGAELVYKVERGRLVQDEFHDFAPRDCQPLVLNNVVHGVQIAGGGTIEESQLPGSVKGFPAKGFWYAHRAVYGKHYGQSQIRSAWRPWRRLTGRDGLEEVMDIACYRFGTGQTVVRAPLGDYKATNQPNGQTRQSAMERAREMAEHMKAGGAIALPSTVDEHGNKEWDLDSFQPNMNLSELIAGAEYLEKKCSKAIGFPPELLEAADTGSGFSGRAIPLQGFLLAQQHVAQGLFFAWLRQIGEPLIWWNFGPNAWVKCKVISLLKTYRQMGQPQPPAGQPGVMPQPGQQQPGQGQPQAADAAQGASDGGGQPAPPANTPGAPYFGPHGGRGHYDSHGKVRYDAQGRVHYTHQLSTSSEAALAAAQAVESGMNGEDAKRNLLRLANTLAELEDDELEAIEKALER